MSSPAMDSLPADGGEGGGGGWLISSCSGAGKWTSFVSRRFQHFLDRSTPHALGRWICTFFIACTYVLRVYLIEGFYVVSYGLGIYILNLLIGFLSPQVDPELQAVDDGPTLPISGSDEFRPFVRLLPEFKFWRRKPFFNFCILSRAFCIAFVMTFFSIFDVPVFWPILLMYWLVLFVATMKRQINHMIKYKYVPFSVGKQRYTGKKIIADEDVSLLKS